MTKVFYITGTDTDVGKTIISAALLKAFNSSGLSTSAIKPIASGCERLEGVQESELRNSDALLLQSHASLKLPYIEVNPFAFEPAIAPHIAAQEANIKVSSMSLIKHTQQVIEKNTDVCVVEGAGGYFVPLNETETLADFAKDLNGNVILVVAIRLGCINHALLTAKAIQQDGLNLVGWVANFCETEEGLAFDRQKENIVSIQSRINAPLLARVPRFEKGSEEEKINKASLCFYEGQLKSIL